MSDNIPVGVITAFAGTTPPEGWLLCDGQPCGNYPDLIAVLGTNVTPDLRDRFLKGTATAPRVAGGSATVPVPAHNHGGATGTMKDITTGQPSPTTHTHAIDPVADHQHQVPVVALGRYFNSAAGQEQVSVVVAGDKRTGQGGNHNHAIATVSLAHSHGTLTVGGGEVFEPQFYALAYIIKAVAK